MKNLTLIFITIWMILFLLIPTFGQNDLSKDLKAILIVGHQEDGTKKAMESMNKIAVLLQQKGVIVYKFYNHEANWEEIVKVSKKCNFFIYSGHGSTVGVDGNTGGLCINSIISTSRLISELKLKENSLVLFKSVCGGAGSSAGDDEDIGIAEAKNRVTHYAYPFFEIGASAYCANNFSTGVYNFLDDFLSGIALKTAYLNSTKIWLNVEFEEPFLRDTTKSFSIASTQGGGMSTRTTYTNGIKKVEQVPTPKGYKIAYVGKQDFSIRDMKNIDTGAKK